MSVVVVLKILFFGMKIFVIVLLLLSAVYFAISLLSLAIVGPPALLLFGLSKAVQLIQVALQWVLVRIGVGEVKNTCSNNERNDFSSAHKHSTAETDHNVDDFDPYTILGVARGSSNSEILRAYRLRMVENHPDKVAHLDPVFSKLAHDRTLLLQRAYEALVKAA